MKLTTHISSDWLRGLGTALSLLLAVAAHATHNRAGEIRVEQIGTSLTVRATIVTYTAFQGNSVDADRPFVRVQWGDGTTDSVRRSNGPLVEGVPNGVRIGPNIKINIYIAEHTYSGRGRYVIGMQDPNRVDGIRNINAGGSTDVRFYIQTTFTFLDPNFQGPNRTPQLLQPPIDVGCVGQPFTHNPNAFDPDGDSLAYRLGVPAEGEGVPVANYLFPNEIGGGAGPREFRLDPVTGTITWRNPTTAADYNVVILVISYRGGQPIDTTVRDMQITIRTCDNRPPQIEVAQEFCLVAGDTLTLEPVATAPLSEPEQQVRLTVTSATLEPGFFAPASWNGDTLFHPQPWQRRYRWETVCEHTERFPYQIIFKATDNGAVAGVNEDLSWLEVVRVRVSAPPPVGLAIEATDLGIDLSWDAPYRCEDAADDYFFGFSVWRREGSNPFAPDSCRPGLEGRGYTRVALRERDQSSGRYRYLDRGVERGRTYCYRVLAQFARYTASGRPFNLVESLPSAEVCIQSSREIPLLTRVDVLSTSTTNGSIDVRWTPPLASDLDTARNPAPYTYFLSRSPGIGTSDFVEIAGSRRQFASFAALARDSQFVDTGLDTRTQGYTYALTFVSAGQTQPLPPLPSSSVFLQAAPSDRAVRLTWLAQTSWENFEYAVLRADGAGGFDTLARVTETSYLDRGLTNGVAYCYQIVSFGTYGVAAIPAPLVNRSQELCAVPEDLIGPCPPVPRVQSVCDEEVAEDLRPPYRTTVSWGFGGSCPPSDDLTAVRVYAVADSAGGDRRLLGELAWPQDSSFQVRDSFQIARCYALAAVDSVGNEGDLSGVVCVGNCPLYQLPNVITPNGDGRHDVLRPRINRFVARVDLEMFNRWGVRVYATEDPTLGWDGTTLTGDPVSDGTYHYVCRVFQQLPDGSVEEVAGPPVSGFVNVIRDGQ